MGFSKSSAEGRRRELRIFRRVIVGAVIAATGLHLSSAPWVMQLVNGMFGDLEVELVDDAIEFFVVDEAVPELETPVTPPPPSAAAIDNEPAASAAEDSAPPLKTSESVIPTPPTAESIDTIATESEIATEDGVAGGQGAAGNADTIGLISGDGSLEGDPTAPVGPPNVRQREPVPEVARASPPAARLVTCAPCSSPDYPLSERREDIEGQPVINVIFDASGNIVEAVIERSSGNAAFDQAALAEAQANWQFRDPYGLGGQVSVEVNFVIEGSEQFDAATAAGRREAIELPVQQSIVPVTPPGTAASPAEEREPAVETAPPATAETDAEMPAEDEPNPASAESLEDLGIELDGDRRDREEISPAAVEGNGEAIAPDTDSVPDPEEALEAPFPDPPTPSEDPLEPPVSKPATEAVEPLEAESIDEL
ncbi:MAG: TonB family protein [Leptolyngbya sp. SIOISBB]|nr:TonB family protein [Leptolyngbya sp. SIOISBB]